MTIAVHISLPVNKGNYSRNFNLQCFSLLASQHPEHHFIFISDRSFVEQSFAQENITPVVTGPQIRNRLLSHYWYNFKLPSILDKYHADIFINDGVNGSLRKICKQFMLVNDLSFLQKHSLFKKAEHRYLKKYFKKFAANAYRIIVPSAFLADELKKRFSMEPGKVVVIPTVLDSETGYGYEKLEHIKTTYTGGREYFLAYISPASAANTIVLLKAFSLFKKRQLSNMKLVLLFTQNEQPPNDIANYKYREDLVLFTNGSQPQLSEITTAAYAAIYLPCMEIMEEEGLPAIQYGIPLITADNGFTRGLYENAALYTTTAEKDIAEKMMFAYKDENLRNELIENGKLLAEASSWVHSSAKLWSLIGQQ